VHPDNSYVMKNLSGVYRQNSPRISDEFSQTARNGETRMLTFAPVKGLPSVNRPVGLSIDKTKAYSMLSECRASAVIAAIIAVVLIMLLLNVLM
jgi:methyl-accepting chemotaxis protein